VLTATVLTLFVAVDQAFIMALYFAIAAYFTTPSLERKGARRFVADRLLRLGLPLAFQVLVISPLLSYVLRVTLCGFGASLGDHLIQYWVRDHTIEVGSLWFVEALLIFSLCYALWWRRSGGSQGSVRSAGEAPSDRILVFFALGIGLVTFAVRIAYPVGRILWPLAFNLAHFPQYIAWFITGVVAYHQGWLDSLTDARARAWGRLAALLIVIAPLLFAVGGALEGNTAPFLGGVHWQALVYALPEQLLCLGMIISLLVGFRNRYPRQGWLATEMSSSAYAVYVIYAPVLVLISLALRDLTLFPLLKFALVSLLTAPACFSIAACVRRLPVARRIL